MLRTKNGNPSTITNRYITEANELLVYDHKEVFDKDNVVGY